MVKYTKQFKRKVIKHYLNGKLGFKLVAAHHKITPPMVRRWVAAYRLHGEESLCRRRKHYSIEFKLSVLRHMWDNALSHNQAAAVFNIPNPATIGSWERRQSNGGREALGRIRKAIPDMPAPALKPDNKPEQELTREQLLERIEYLQMEVAVLKKLEALTQARKAAAPKKRK